MPGRGGNNETSRPSSLRRSALQLKRQDSRDAASPYSYSKARNTGSSRKAPSTKHTASKRQWTEEVPRTPLPRNSSCVAHVFPTSQEDRIVCDHVAQLGPRKWSKIASYLPGRIGKQCRERCKLSPRRAECPLFYHCEKKSASSASHPCAPLRHLSESHHRLTIINPVLRRLTHHFNTSDGIIISTPTSGKKPGLPRRTE